MSITIETDLKEILEKLDQKMDRQFSQLDQKMDQQFSQLDQKMDRQFSQLDQKMDRQFEKLDQKVDRMQEDINKLQVGQAKIEGEIKALDNKGSVIQPIITGITVAFAGGGLLALYKYLP
jgi:chromosome segregation ATPase